LVAALTILLRPPEGQLISGYFSSPPGGGLTSDHFFCAAGETLDFRVFQAKAGFDSSWLYSKQYLKFQKNRIFTFGKRATFKPKQYSKL
jgi:hypothetical protein